MSAKADYTTPPESFVHPLTPPASHDRKPNKPTASSVAHIITHLRLRQAGHSDASSPWTVFRLSPDGAEQLFVLLKADEALWSFVQDKVRSDYFSSSGLFVLRMPTTVHEWFRSSVVHKIQEQLDRIEDGKSAEFARLVRDRGSPKLHFPIDDKGKKFNSHEPDAAFIHPTAQWPGVIIEVSFSQKRKMLKDLAEDYIFGSDGNIHVVIGLDIEYRQSKMATLSMWRPQLVESEDGEALQDLVCEQTVTDQMFRDEAGNPVGDGDSLVLRLRDFLPSRLSHNVAGQRIVIPFRILYGFIVQAEAYAKQFEEGQGMASPLKPGTRKRLRPRTPEEQLCPEDEQRVVDEEERAAKRVEIEDVEYVPSNES